MRHTRSLLFVTGAILLAACQDVERRPIATEPENAVRADVTPQTTASLLVTFFDRGDNRLQLIQAINDAGGSITREYENFPVLAFRIPDSPDLRARLAALEGVRSIDEDGVFGIDLDESLAVMRINTVHALGFRGAGQTVAVLDNGFDRDHPFIAGRVVEEACFSQPTGGTKVSLCPSEVTTLTGANSASLNVTPCTNGANNLCTHGSHVAGIAAGNGAGIAGAPAAGVAPDANLILVQVFHRENSSCGTRPAPCTLTSWSDLIAGIDYVYGLRNNHSIVSLNMSLGGGANAVACDANNLSLAVAMSSLLSADIMPVAAAGNNSNTNGVSLPACLTNVVAVGNTTDTDQLAASTDRGVLLDLFAIGTGVISSINNAGYASFNGTSMAAPHVAGAFAVLRSAYPTEGVGDLLARMTTTGVGISYESGGVTVTTPRLDLAAALAAGQSPPNISVGASTVTVNEGATATNSGTASAAEGVVASISASVGTVSLGASGTWNWSFATSDGPAQSQTVTITATSNFGVTSTKTFQLDVKNVAPTVTFAASQMSAANEGGTIAINATLSDPGVTDGPFIANATCYTLAGGQQLVVAVTVGSLSVVNGTLTGSLSSSGCQYGDNGKYTLELSVTDKDGAKGSAQREVDISNVKPAVTMGGDNTTLVNGVPTVFTSINTPTAFSSVTTDPGSDDLSLLWDWKDGTTASAASLNLAPNPDPVLSPSLNPRSFNNAQSKSFAQACFRQISLRATDDDGGVTTQTANVVIAGNSERARSSGYWQTQYRNVRSSAVGEGTLLCYLQIAAQLSSVYNEIRDASTLAKAGAILQNSGSSGDMRFILDQQLLAAWINFANGAYGWNDLVDTNGDKIPDTPFAAAIAGAEAVRGNPASTKAQLEAQKIRMEAINLM